MEETISRQQLLELLRSIGRPTIVTITARTDPSMVKKHRETKEPNPYWGKVEKRSRVNGVICFSYANAVTNQKVREVDPESIEALEGVEPYEPAPRTWGNRLHGTPLVEHTPKGAEEPKFYLELKVERSLGHFYYIDGKEMDLDASKKLECYLPLEAPRGGRQNLEKPVILRDYELSTIEYIQVNKKLYKVAA